jgi:hypothetical protein
VLTPEQRQQFDEQGYVVVPGVLSGEEVAQLRAALRPKFEVAPGQGFAGDGDGVLFDVFNRYPETRRLLFHSPSIEVLRSLLGDDFVVLRECAAHLERFGSWHKDTTSQERAGHRFHHEQDYCMVEAAYYLQDNDPIHGGGLDVEPGSHRHDDVFARRTLLQRAWGKVAGGPKLRDAEVVSVPSRAGDLVIFDFRLNHRATPRRSTLSPGGTEKIAIFQACSSNTHHVDAYHAFISGWEPYVYLRGFAYPTEVLAEAREHNLTLG